jgi:hypothetical protein
MESGLQDRYAIVLESVSHDRPVPLTLITHLEHVKQSRLASIVEAEEEEFGMLVEQAEVGQDVPDCA